MTAERFAQFKRDDPATRHVRLLRASEAAEALGVSRCTLWRWTARVENRLPCIRFGSNCTRFKVTDIAAFIEANQGG